MTRLAPVVLFVNGVFLTPVAESKAVASVVSSTKDPASTAFQSPWDRNGPRQQRRAGAFQRAGNDFAASSTQANALREATFGMGCFWEPAESFLKEPGILATTVGYTGAPPSKASRAPSYDTVCFGNDWVEAVRVVYDDDVTSYGRVLDAFFQLQKPGYQRQYASVIFVDGDQEKTAEQWLQEALRKDTKRQHDHLPASIVEIEPLSNFYRAEEYHQRYWEKQRLRAFVGVIFIAGASGAFSDVRVGGKSLEQFLAMVPLLNGVPFETFCNGAFLLGAAWLLLERLLVRDVRELKTGDLVASLS